MENNKENDFNREKKDRELILFDKGFIEIPYNEKNEKASSNIKNKSINWFSVYLTLFKNTLNSKNLVPKEELKLRLNIIRKYLPPYYNCQKNIENSNSSSILKKFSYHLYSKSNLIQRLIEKKNTKKILDFDDDNDENIISKIDSNQMVTRRRAKTRTEKFSFTKLNLLSFNDKKNRQKKPKNLFNSPLQIVEENNDVKNNSLEKRTPKKRGTLKSSEKYFFSGHNLNHKKEETSKKLDNLNRFLSMETNIKVKFDKKNSELNKVDNNKDVVIRTPNDKEYPLVLTEKRLMNNNNQTYFMDFLGKLNEETKNEKINTYKKEVTSQILKFNEMYFDTKMDDFSKDNLFNELKSTCDMFINKFNFDNQEEKNLGDLDKFL